MSVKIPVSVVVVTKNEEKNIARCLHSLRDFVQIIVVDSGSTDRTVSIARDLGAKIVHFHWNGMYPKKRQWCLDTIRELSDWVFWVDADEVLTPEIVCEIRDVFQRSLAESGFFIRGRYVWEGEILKWGMANNKIALMNRHKMMFPVVNDLEIGGMGEIEGHYQPVFRDEAGVLGQVKAPLLHYAYEDGAGWENRHERYAHWEAQMSIKGAWPQDPVQWRETIKRFLRTSRFRPRAIFSYSYVLKCGFLDGWVGLKFAYSRMWYCSQVYDAYKLAKIREMKTHKKL